MNDLLERLESQKAKLPLEDHSIIDWGISAIRIRMQQKEKLMDEVSASLENIITKLIEEWKKNPKHQAIYESFMNTLPSIICTGSHFDYDEATKGAISRLKESLKKHFKNHDDSFQKVLNYSSKFCTSKANEIENNLNLNKIKKSEMQQSKKLADTYRLAAKDLLGS